MLQVKFIWNGEGNDEGLWKGDKMIASLGQLEREGYSLDYLLGCTEKRLEAIATKIERDTALPVSVDAGNIEDWL